MMCIKDTLNSIKKRKTNNFIGRRGTTNYFLNAVHEYNSDLPDDSKKSFSYNNASFKIYLSSRIDKFILLSEKYTSRFHRLNQQ